MHWLAEQFGIERLLHVPVLLPTDARFPSDYRGTAEDAKQIMLLLSDCMNVDVTKLQLEICDDAQLPNALGHYDGQQERRVIRIAESQLYDAEALIATLAHELSHELLLGGGLLTGEEPDHEWITDLLPVYLGVGIFAANTTVRETFQRTGNSSWGWSTGKRGYLPARMLGYAFALFAWTRDEANPQWATYLRLDAKHVLRRGLRYLQRTQDSLFQLPTVKRQRAALTTNQLLNDLQSGTPSHRIAALWDLKERNDEGKAAAESVARCLRHQDGDLRAEAANTLAAFGDAASDYVPELCRVLRDRNHNVRRNAAAALGVLRFSPERAVHDLGEVLRDEVEEVVLFAAWSLAQFDRDAEVVLPELLSALRQSCIDCRDSTAGTIVAAIHAAASDPESAIRGCFREFEREYEEHALALLAEYEASKRP
jgi:hypothetical protein